MIQRRNNDRQKTFLRGRIHYNNKMSSADCLVRDFSGAGARLIFDSVIALPDVVELYIAQREQTLPAQIRWRSDLEVGVSFEIKNVGDDTASAGKDELLIRLMKLEEQIQSLQKVVKQLKANQGDKEDFFAVA